ncbi:BatA domain-containing protein [candidate division KSB1 bacterium]
MTFLQSIFLYGLAAAVIPLLIHLFSRLKKDRIPFSSLYFLKLLESRRIRNIKLRQYLLLLIRTLIIALLVLTFSRPTLFTSSGSDYSSESPVSAVIILDNSLSTSADIDGVTALELIKRQALEVLNSFKDGDELYFLTTGGFTEDPGIAASLPKGMANTIDLDLLRRNIENNEVSNRSADLQAVLQYGFELLAPSANLFREIYLISDLQASNFPDGASHAFRQDGLSDPAGNEPNPVRVYCIQPVDDAPLNIGITGIEMRNRIIERGKQFTLRGYIKNYSDEPLRDVLASLYFDGKRVAQRDISLNAGSIETLDFQIVPERAGLMNGVIEIEDDPFSSDNRGYIAVRIPDKIPVLLINDNPEAQVFFESIFSSDNNSPIELRVIDRAEITSVDFKNFKAVIFNGFTDFSDADIYRLRNYCAGGGGVVIFPFADSDTGSFNRTVGNAFSLPVLEGFTGKIIAAGDNDPDFLQVQTIDFVHPVFDGMYNTERPELDLPVVYFSVNIMERRNTRTIISLSNDRPFLTETRVDDGSIFLFSSAPLLSWNNLPLKGMFPPLMFRIVQYLDAGGTVENSRLIVGDPITAYYTGPVDDLYMISPSSDSFRLTPKIVSDAFRIEFHETDLAGIYRFVRAGQEIKEFAVNNDPAESDLHRLSEARLDELFGEHQYQLWIGEQDISQKIKETRSGREISIYFLAAAIALLLMEAIVQFERRKKEPGRND